MILALSLFAAAVVVFALAGALPRRTGVAGAFDFGAAMAALAGVFVLLDAHILGLYQIVTHLAIATVLLLLIMIMGGSRDADARALDLRPARLLRMLGAGGLAFAFVTLVRSVMPSRPASGPGVPAGFGESETLAIELFQHHALLLAGVGLLLVAAVVGAGIVSGRRLD